MKIFDCFMYFDEDLVLDLRLNYLNQFVDHFIIVESVFNHKGEKSTCIYGTAQEITDEETSISITILKQNKETP